MPTGRHPDAWSHCPPPLSPAGCRWPNTLMAHQLVALAEEEGLAGEAVDMLFERT